MYSKEIEKIKQNLEWLFDLNNDKHEFVNFIINKRLSWAKVLSKLVQDLRTHKALGIQQKFEKIGYNGDDSYEYILSLQKELEVGLFLLSKGEQVKFREGQNSPDLISGINSFNKIWEVKSIYNDPYLTQLMIEGSRIIRSWDMNLVGVVKLSLRLSGFIPEKKDHQYHKESIELALEDLRHFDPTKTSREIHSRDMIIELTQSRSNFSGIGTILEGGMERMAHLVSKEEEFRWIDILRNNICSKSTQLISNIQYFKGKEPWDSPHYQFVAIVTDAYIFDEDYLERACFGTFDLHSNKYITDKRIIDIKSSHPWFDYIQANCYDSTGRLVREPKGAFLYPSTDMLHGVLLLSSNRTPQDHKVVLNPFVSINNNSNFIGIYS